MAEVKTTFTSEDKTSSTAKAVGESIKGVGESADSASGSLDKAGKSADSAGEQLKKMSSREVAEKILSVAQNLDKIGDVLDAISTKNAPKFEQGMSAAVHGVTTVVGMIAPEFAPVVAIVGTLVTKVAEWALGMKDAAQASAELSAALKDQSDQLQHVTNLAKIRATSQAEILDIERKSIKTQLDDQYAAFEKEKTLHGEESDEAKGHWDNFVKLRRDYTETSAQIEVEAEKDRKKAAEDAAKAQEDAAKEHHKKQEDAEREHAQVIRDIQSEMIEGQKTGFIGFQNYMHAARFAGAKSAADADKAISDSAKKSADDQKKAAADMEKKVSASYQSMFNFIAGAMKDWKGALSKLLDDLTSKWMESMAAQASSSEAGASRTVTSQGTAVGAFAGATSSITTSNEERIRGGILGFFAPLGPFGEAAAVALISLFINLLKSKTGLEEGYVGQGRQPGLGRSDDISAKINPRESVMNEGAPEAIGRAFLDAANRGKAFAPGGTGGGTSEPVVIELVLREPTDAAMRSHIERIDAMVIRGRARLHSTHLKQ